MKENQLRFLLPGPGKDFELTFRILIVLGAILFTHQSFSQRSAISAKVEMYNNRPTIFINSQPEYPMIYSLTDVPGGRWTWEEVPRYNMKSFCDLGIKLIQVDIAFDHVWSPSGDIVMDTVQRQLKGVLQVCPQASIFIRFHVNPPKWWQRKFPEENCVYADTQPKPDVSWGIERIIEDDEETATRHSLASEKWKDEASFKLKEFLHKLVALPEGNALAGIQVAGGVYGEWHYWGFIENEPDMSQPMLNYFRNWLKLKYKSDKMLQQVWHIGNITLENAALPTLDERRNPKAGVFRDPATERNVIDYYKAQHELIADNILHFCKIIKEEWPRPIITGAFYGYFYSVFGREAAGGHLELYRVLNSPYIDYLSGPGTYYPSANETGDPYRSRSLINSIALHGKLWLDEMDQQPPLVPLKDSLFNESLSKSIANTKRNVMATFTKGQGLWFYDFGPSGFNGGARLKDHGSWGWWDEPTLRETIKQLKELGDERLKTPYKSEADVLLVHDTESFYYMGSDKKHTAISHRANNWLPVGIFRSGVVHDVIHIKDLERVNLNQYKAVVFVNTFVLTQSQRNMIQTKVQKNKRHLIWIYAPGYSDGEKLNTIFIKQVTGINVELRMNQQLNSITVDSSFVKDYAFSVGNSAVMPSFVVKDKAATPLGKYKSTSDIGIAKKVLKENTSWYLGLPPENPAFWRRIFKEAGAHVYNESGDIFYSGSDILSIHTKSGGRREVNLKNGTVLKLDQKANSTTLIDLTTNKVIE